MTNHEIKIEIALNIDSILGEGAIWDDLSGRLLWVDIEKCLLHIFDPATGSNKSIDTGSRIGTVVPIGSNKLLVALQNGIHTLDLQHNDFEFKGNPLTGDKIRFNDGKCDAQGRLWVGSIHMDGEKNQASLYKVDGDYQITMMLDNITNSNGLAWKSDQSAFYYIDTATQKIQSYEFNPQSGELNNPRTIYTFSDDEGSPDGMTIDNQDRLWVALYGGGAVVCIDPESEKQLYKIPLPAPNITSCAFGGKELDKLYITSAREGLSDEQLYKFPLSGSLFVAHVEATGVKANYFQPA